MQNRQTSAKQEDVQTFFIKNNVDLKVKGIGKKCVQITLCEIMQSI